MALKYIVESLDGLDQGVAALYEKTDQGFRLDVEGVVPRAKLDEFRDNNVKLSEQLKSFEGIDPKRWKTLTELEQRVKDKDIVEPGQIEKTVQDRVAQMKEEHDKILTGLQHENQATKAQLESLLIDSAVRVEALELGALPSAIEDVILRAKASIKLVDGVATPHSADGKPIYGKDGVNPMSVKEWVIGLQKSAGHLFEKQQGGGPRGGNGGGRTKGAAMTSMQKIAAGLDNL